MFKKFVSTKKDEDSVKIDKEKLLTYAILSGNIETAKPLLLEENVYPNFKEIMSRLIDAGNHELMEQLFENEHFCKKWRQSFPFENKTFYKTNIYGGGYSFKHHNEKTSEKAPWMWRKWELKYLCLATFFKKDIKILELLMKNGVVPDRSFVYHLATTPVGRSFKQKLPNLFLINLNFENLEIFLKKEKGTIDLLDTKAIKRIATSSNLEYTLEKKLVRCAKLFVDHGAKTKKFNLDIYDFTDQIAFNRYHDIRALSESDDSESENYESNFENQIDENTDTACGNKKFFKSLDFLEEITKKKYKIYKRKNKNREREDYGYTSSSNSEDINSIMESERKDSDDDELDVIIKDEPPNNKNLSEENEGENSDNDNLSEENEGENSDNDNLSEKNKYEDSDDDELDVIIKDAPPNNKNLSEENEGENSDNDNLSEKNKYEDSDDDELNVTNENDFNFYETFYDRIYDMYHITYTTKHCIDDSQCYGRYYQKSYIRVLEDESRDDDGIRIFFDNWNMNNLGLQKIINACINNEFLRSKNLYLYFVGNNNFSEFNSEKFKDIKELKIKSIFISHNKFIRIFKADLPHLENLVLNKTAKLKICEINAPKLKFFEIYESAIKRLEVKDMPELIYTKIKCCKNLERLFFDERSVENIRRLDVIICENLKEFYLPTKAMKSLNYLSLCHLNMKTLIIDPNAPFLKNLVSLNLEGNCLEHFDENIFTKFKALEHLDLRHNNFTYFKFFKNLKTITSLIIMDNEISHFNIEPLDSSEDEYKISCFWFDRNPIQHRINFNEFKKLDDIRTPIGAGFGHEPERLKELISRFEQGKEEFLNTENKKYEDLLFSYKTNQQVIQYSKKRKI